MTGADTLGGGRGYAVEGLRLLPAVGELKLSQLHPASRPGLHAAVGEELLVGVADESVLLLLLIVVVVVEAMVVAVVEVVVGVAVVGVWSEARVEREACIRHVAAAVGVRGAGGAARAAGAETGRNSGLELAGR